MANISAALEQLWIALTLRLEMLGVPREVLPAFLALAAIGILFARRHNMKRNTGLIVAEETSANEHHIQDGDTLSTARTIEGYCIAAHWSCNRTDDVVHVTFSLENGTEQTVFVNCYPTLIEVVGLLPFSYSDMDDAPHDLSNSLMKLNAGRKSAFWAIYDIAEEHYYCLVDNIPLARMSRDRILSTVKTIRDGCSEMITALVEAAAEA